MNRQEIIHRLESLKDHAAHTQGEARFVMSLDDGIAICEAIELLKEQEPVKALAYDDDSYICSNCGTVVGWDEWEPGGIEKVRYKFCPECGRAVKWYD